MASSTEKAEGKIVLQPNFNAADYMGQWYEIYRTKNIRFERGTDITANYKANDNGTVGVTNKEWLEDKKRWNTANAIAYVVEPARLSVKFRAWLPGGDYRVLFTDYNNVAVVYSEFSIFGGFFKRQFAWILGRSQQLPEETIDKAFGLLKEQTGLNRADFLQTPHGVAPTDQQ